MTWWHMLASAWHWCRLRCWMLVMYWAMNVHDVASLRIANAQYRLARARGRILAKKPKPADPEA